MTDEVEKSEEAARKIYKWVDEFFEWVWERGKVGKIALLLWFLVLFAPPVFNGYAIYFLWFHLYPIAATLTERLAVVGVLVALANAEALWLNNVLFQSMFAAYTNRRRRRKRVSS